jgi:Flp pilus assembly pilin Flp
VTHRPDYPFSGVRISAEWFLHSRSAPFLLRQNEGCLQNLVEIVWCDEGQDIAEYAVILAVILVIVIGTIRLIGSNANNVFSSTASSIQ